MMVMHVDEKILKILREGRSSAYLSGRELGRQLSLSRTAIWKHIKSLRKAGYDIESRPSQGYRLKELSKPFNELEMTAELETRIIGRPLFYYPKVESTSSVALEMAENESPEGTTIIADCQEKGRGRMGRSWESPPGFNIYLSLILRPTFPPVNGSHMTFLAANAVVKAIKKLPFTLLPQIKWPNDILINNKKVAGILTEMNSEMDRINFIILTALRN
jgi:BirA family biotin operon repressor/biotin-[acetyl-CoA-carboxylase] ligase